MICKRPEFFSRIAYFSALILNLGTPPRRARKSFGNIPELPVSFAHQNPDRTLNRKTRPLSMPDRNPSRKKEGDKSRAPHDARVVLSYFAAGGGLPGWSLV